MYYVVCAKIIDFKTVDFIDSGEISSRYFFWVWVMFPKLLISQKLQVR